MDGGLLWSPSVHHGACTIISIELSDSRAHVSPGGARWRAPAPDVRVLPRLVSAVIPEIRGCDHVDTSAQVKKKCPEKQIAPPMSDPNATITFG
jgi:hypothetical protein